MRLPDAIPVGNVYAGTFGGMLFSVFGNILAADIAKTAILAAIGAVVSFVVSATLRAVFNRHRKPQGTN